MPPKKAARQGSRVRAQTGFMRNSEEATHEAEQRAVSTSKKHIKDMNTAVSAVAAELKALGLRLSGSDHPRQLNTGLSSLQKKASAFVTQPKTSTRLEKSAITELYKELQSQEKTLSTHGPKAEEVADQMSNVMRNLYTALNKKRMNREYMNSAEREQKQLQKETSDLRAENRAQEAEL